MGYKAIEDPLFPTPFAKEKDKEIVEMIFVSTQKKGIKLKIAKEKSLQK